MIWKDHVVQYPGRFKMDKNSDGTVTLIPASGNTIQQGTALNAENLNNLLNRIDYVGTSVDNVVLDVSSQCLGSIASMIWSEKAANMHIDTTQDFFIDSFIDQTLSDCTAGNYDSVKKCYYVI